MMPNTSTSQTFTLFIQLELKWGGGVAIYVLKSYSEANVLISKEQSNCNFLAIDLVTHRLKILTVYRPPNADASQYLETIDRILKYNLVSCSGIFLERTFHRTKEMY